MTKRKVKNKKTEERKKIIKLTLIGFAIGAAFIAVIWGITVIFTKESSPTKTGTITAPLHQDSQESSDPEIELSYRKDLREQSKATQTNRRSSSSQTKTTKSASKKAPAAAPANINIIQVGVFTLKENAENLRARLILLNLPVKVRASKTGGQKKYKVVVGPFSKSAKAKKAIATLKREQIEYVY